MASASDGLHQGQIALLVLPVTGLWFRTEPNAFHRVLRLAAKRVFRGLLCVHLSFLYFRRPPRSLALAMGFSARRSIFAAAPRSERASRMVFYASWRKATSSQPADAAMTGGWIAMEYGWEGVAFTLQGDKSVTGYEMSVPLVQMLIRLRRGESRGAA
jgi:hypothetical protein